MDELTKLHGPVSVADATTPTQFPSVAGNSVLLNPEVPTREILLVQLQMKEEENRQLRIQLKAALEAIGRSHSYGTDPNIARIRGHPELQEEHVGTILSTVIKPVPQGEPERESSLVTEYPPMCPVQQSTTSSADRLQQDKCLHEKAGLDPDKAGLDLEKAGLDPEKAGLDPEKAGYDLEKAGLDPDEAGYDLEKAGLDLEKAGLDPDKAGYDLEKAGLDPEKAGYDLEKAGLDPDKAGYDLEKAGYDPDKAGIDRDKAGYDLEKGGYDLEKAGLDPDKAGLDLEKAGYDPEKAGIDPEKAGIDPESIFEKNREIENLRAEVQHLRIKMIERQLKGRTESEVTIPNKDNLFLEFGPSYSDAPNRFNSPVLDLTLQSEFDKLHELGLKGKDIAIALLGPKCSRNHLKTIIAEFPRAKSEHDDADTQNGNFLHNLLQHLVPEASLILCHTTFDVKGTQIDQKVHNEALQWIRDNQEEWMEQHKLKGIFVCIPYGGKYNACGEKVVNDALAKGILLVCAAGCRDTGIAFPAGLGPPVSCGAADGDHAATYSPQGRELDLVIQSFVRGENYFVDGTATAAVIATAQLVILVQYIVQQLECCCPHMAVLKEVLLLSSRSEPHSHDLGHGTLEVHSIITRPSDLIKNKLDHIRDRRDRMGPMPGFDEEDAISTSKILSSDSLNQHWNVNSVDKSFPSLKGKGKIVALIDDFGKLIATCAKYELIGSSAKSCTILGKDLLKYRYIKQLCKESHGVQCAVVVAHIAPEVKLLLVHDDEDENVLTLIEKEGAHVLAITATVYDTYDFEYSHNLNHLARRCVVVCAAGNEGKTDAHSTLAYPGRHGDVLTIGACDISGNKIGLSSYGRELDFMAPGRFSNADPTGAAGTSLAAPAAAAEIALILEYIDQTCTGEIPALGEKNEWAEIKVAELAQNTQQMRHILRCPQLQLCQSPTKHSPDEGHGILLIHNLSTVTPAGIVDVIKKFHSDC